MKLINAFITLFIQLFQKNSLTFSLADIRKPAEILVEISAGLQENIFMIAKIREFSSFPSMTMLDAALHPVPFQVIYSKNDGGCQPGNQIADTKGKKIVPDRHQNQHPRYTQYTNSQQRNNHWNQRIAGTFNGTRKDLNRDIGKVESDHIKNHFFTDFNNIFIPCK